MAGLLGLVGSALDGIGIGLIISLIAILLSGGDRLCRPLSHRRRRLPPSRARVWARRLSSATSSVATALRAGMITETSSVPVPGTLMDLR